MSVKFRVEKVKRIIIWNEESNKHVYTYRGVTLTRFIALIVERCGLNAED